METCPTLRWMCPPPVSPCQLLGSPAMPHDDFDTDGLAEYLHLMPAQVDRLANRGRIPGRKVAGKWRFSRAEIHQWMEERMGLLDDDELAQMEGVITDSADPADDELPSIAKMLARDS